MLNTSSADRSLPTLIDLFEEVLKRLQKDIRKKTKLEWHYGWHVFDNDYRDDPIMQEFKKKVVSKIESLRARGHFVGGDKLNHKDIANAYLRAGAFAYPSKFYEIHCISAIKAQLAGAVPLVTSFAALAESVQFGIKIPVSGDWLVPKGQDFGIKDPKAQEEWIKATVTYLKNPKAWDKKRKEMKEWAIKSYSWDKLADLWLQQFAKH